MAEISLVHVSKRYRENLNAVKDVNLTIQDKELVMLVGPSGCGKSTILRMIAGLEKISEGELYINHAISNMLEPGERELAMVFQNYALYPHMTVYDNIAFSLRVRHVEKEEIRQRVLRIAKLLGITPLLQRKPSALSGGQRQRVAIGAAIIREAKAYLMDEPLSNLDAKLRAEMRVEIAKLHHYLDATIVYVTHDQVEAMTLADRIVVMNQGVIQQVAPPKEIYENPINQFVAGFIGSPEMNFLPVHCVKYDKGLSLQGEGFCFDPGPALSQLILRRGYGGRELILGVRPEDFMAEADEERADVHFSLEVCENLGAEILLHGCIGGEEVSSSSAMISIRLPAQDPLRKKDKLSFRINRERMHLFAPDTGENLLYEERRIMTESGGILGGQVNESA